jgi:broad specificity phosphatase PhoE
MTAARILLVRHGRSAHAHDGRWMHAADVRAFEDAYDAAGILDDDAPPPELIHVADSADVIAASDLPRAIASARRIAPARDPDITPLLREFRLEPSDWMPRLPVQAWDVLSHLQWSYRLLSGAPHDVITRANEAAEWLAQRAAEAVTVVAVTHGGFRRVIAHRLEARGWRAGPERRSYANWSVWSFLRQQDPSGGP